MDAPFPVSLAAALGRRARGLIAPAGLRRLGVTVALALAVAVGHALSDLTLRMVDPGPVPYGAPPASLPASGPAAGGATTPRLEELAALELFGAPEKEGTDAVAEPVPADVPETRLRLRLHGVLAPDGSEPGRAIIDDGDGPVVVTVGEAVGEDARVRHVLPDRVILERDGAREALTFPREELAVDRAGSRSGKPPAPASGDAPSPDGRLRTLAALARVQPVLEGGGVVGYRLRATDRGIPYFEAAGISSEDVVTAVEGVPVTDTARLQGLSRELMDAERIRLRVRRDGASREVTLRVD